MHASGDTGKPTLTITDNRTGKTSKSQLSMRRFKQPRSVRLRSTLTISVS